MEKNKKQVAMEMYQTETDSAPEDAERTDIQSELSKMTFEELQKLKEKLGSKVYKEAVFGTNSIKQTTFKRENKNHPREASSKVKPTLIEKKVKQKQVIDPRFNRLCGTFYEKQFENDYSFITEIRKREKAKLKSLLKETKDESKKEEIKYLLQRMDNQDREKEKRLKDEKKKEKERQEQIQALESGKKPHFKTKFEKKIVQLVDKYSDLKKSGKINKYIEKKQKQQNRKAKKPRYFERNIMDTEE